MGDQDPRRSRRRIARGSGARPSAGADDLTPLAARILDIAQQLTDLYLAGKVASDLDRAIHLLREAERLPAVDARIRTEVLAALGYALKARYIHAVSSHSDCGTGDIDESIRCYTAALHLLPEDTNPYPILSNLGSAYLGRCVVARDDARSAELAVRMDRLGVAALAPADPYLPTALGMLVSAVELLLTLDGDRGELVAVVHTSGVAVAGVPDGSPIAAQCALRHAELLHLVRDRVDADLLDEELSAWLRVSTTEQPDKTLRSAFYGVGTLALERYDRSHNSRDLDLAVKGLRDAAPLAVDGNPNDVGYFALLGTALALRAKATPNPVDLDEAIAAFRTALRCGGRPEERHALIDQLCSLLVRRFHSGHNLADLDETIEIRTATLSEWEGPGYRAPGTAAAEEAHRLRFQLTGSSADACMALYLGHFQALHAGGEEEDRRPAGKLRSFFNIPYTELAARRRNLNLPAPVLAATRRMRMHPDLELADEVDEQINWLRQALDHATDDAERLALLDDLVDALGARLLAAPSDEAFDESVIQLRRLLRLIPADDAAHRGAHEMQLAMILHQRFLRHDRTRDLDEALDLLRRAAAAESLSSDMRIDAARAQGEIAADNDRWQIADNGFRSAVHLLPRLAARHLSHREHTRQLAPFFGLVSDAAAIAVRNGDPTGALELLEQGRGLLIGQALDARSELHRLTDAHRDLADQLKRIGDELARQDDPHARPTDPGQPSTVDRRRELSHEWDATVTLIRRLPGFEDFLAPVRLADLIPAAEAGPVITINVSRYRCDALILTTDGVDAVALRDLTVEQVNEHVNRFFEVLPFAELTPDDPATSAEAQLPLRATLAWLWDAVGQPVLDHLQSRGIAAQRIWWVPTGMLAVLPLHAAGRVDAGPGASVMDRAVSSYAPTVRALRVARQARSINTDPSGDAHVVAIGDAPNMPSLSGTAVEASRLARRIPGARMSSGRDARRNRVLDALKSCSWFHVACHASSVAAEPTSSALHLQDASLTVSDVMALRPAGGRLAYLSACRTVLGGPEVVDEVIHLGSAFLIAGFRHVVGTLWQVTDGTAVETARLFYEDLGPELDEDQAPWALHAAVTELRERHALLPTRWAPYMHIGP
jgi:tetratricopeptide (TPR) repeat protein